MTERAEQAGHHHRMIEFMDREKLRWGFVSIARVFRLDPAPPGSNGVCRCPDCRTGGVVARPDDRGGRCSHCRRGYDGPGLLQIARGWTFHEALYEMSRADPDAKPQAEVKDLFGM